MTDSRKLDCLTLLMNFEPLTKQPNLKNHSAKSKILITDLFQGTIFVIVVKLLINCTTQDAQRTFFKLMKWSKLPTNW